MTQNVENYFARFNRLGREFKILPAPIRVYLASEGLQEPSDILGSRYSGQFTERDNREVEARWKKFSKVKADLEDLCVKHDLDQNKLERTKQYASDALGL